jgi:hypothetical protein
LAQLGRPPVVGAGAGEEVLGVAGGDGDEPGAERRAHRAGGGVGPGEHHLGGDAVVVELLVADGGVPPAAQADLVEAVALLVLAEPLRLELLVTHERRAVGVDAARVDEGLALGELLVEGVVELGVEVVAVHGRVGARVRVGRDHDVVLQHRRFPLRQPPPSSPEPGAGARRRRPVLADSPPV